MIVPMCAMISCEMILLINHNSKYTTNEFMSYHIMSCHFILCYIFDLIECMNYTCTHVHIRIQHNRDIL